MTTEIDVALNFTPPPRGKQPYIAKILNAYFDPTYVGIENVDSSKPTLFAGNHSRYAALDMTLLSQGIYSETGLFPRGLADRMHYKIPIWRDIVTDGGGIIGSRDMCRAMMKANQTLMVYPGGSREVFKNKSANYKLLWRERYGFVKMALEHDYSITPFACVGADEAFDVVVDSDEIMV